MHEPLESLLAANPAPAASAAFFERMLADIVSGGGALDPIEKVWGSTGWPRGWPTDLWVTASPRPPHEHPSFSTSWPHRQSSSSGPRWALGLGLTLL